MPDAPTMTAGTVATFLIVTGDEEKKLDSRLQVLSILVRHEVNKIPFVRIRIRDGDVATGDFRVSSASTLIPGTKIQVSLGYNVENTLLFSGIITSLTGKVSSRASETIIEARGPAVKMTIAPAGRHYNQVTDSQVAEQLIESYGLSADIEKTFVSYDNLVQYNLSDWDFMVSRLDRMGQIILAEGDSITARQPDLQGSALDLSFGDNILEFQATIDARSHLKQVSVSSWDPGAQQLDSSEAEDEPDGTGNLFPAQLAEVLATPRVDFRSAAPLGEAERQAVANARSLKNSLSLVRGKVRLRGTDQVHAGDTVHLQSFGDRFNGPALATAVRHEYGDGYWITEVTVGQSPEWFAVKTPDAGTSASTDAPGSAPAGSVSANEATGLFSVIKGLQVGTVTSIDDPLQEFRIRIRLPAVNGQEEGIWARVATLDAGADRGTCFYPETGDEVIVGFIHDDPSFPVILGMMYSSKHAPPLPPAQGNNEKGYRSREGLKLHFDDGTRAINLETPAGKRITLSEDEGTVKIEDENSNTITLEASGITLQSGKNLSIEAAGTLSLKAGSVTISADSDVGISGSSVSLQGSSMTQITGGVVTIN